MHILLANSFLKYDLLETKNNNNHDTKIVVNPALYEYLQEFINNLIKLEI